MNPDLLLLFASATALTTGLFMIVAVLWLRKMRQSVAQSLREAATQQILTAQRLHETCQQLEKHQQIQDRRLQRLADANLRLAGELAAMQGRMEHAEREVFAIPADRVLH